MHVERWFTVTPTWHFGRAADGSIVVAHTDGKPPDQGGAIERSEVIDPGIWGSLVLGLSYFDERPRDWQAFMDHHQGRRDMLAAAKDCETLQASLERIRREDDERNRVNEDQAVLDGRWQQ